MSPLVFRIRDAYRDPIVNELKARDIPYAMNTHYGLDYQDEYESWALLDGLVLTSWSGNPIGDTIPSGTRVLGTRILRLACDWLGAVPPRRLASETGRLLSPGGELEAELREQLATQREPLEARAERWVRADDVLAFARAIDELFGRTWALRTTSAKWPADRTWRKWGVIEDWLLAENDWGAAGFCNSEAERLNGLGLAPATAKKWFELAERHRLRGMDKTPMTPGSKLWPFERLDMLDDVAACVGAGLSLPEARQRADAGVPLAVIARRGRDG
jgi:hypothetical protein